MQHLKIPQRRTYLNLFNPLNINLHPAHANPRSITDKTPQGKCPRARIYNFPTPKI